MTTAREIYADIAEILLSYDIAMECSDIFQRVLAIRAFNLGEDALWGNIPHYFTLCAIEGEPNKIGFLVRDQVDEGQFLSFFRENCDPNATISMTPHTSAIIVSADKFRENLIPLFQMLMKTLVDRKTPEIKPHQYSSEYNAHVIKKNYKCRQLMDDKNNPYGQMMAEIDDNLSKLYISAAYTYVLPYALIQMVGGQNSSFEVQARGTTPPKYKIFPGDCRYVDRGWGFASYIDFDLSEYARWSPAENGKKVELSFGLRDAATVEKISKLLKQYCSVRTTGASNCNLANDDNVSYGYMNYDAHAKFTINTEDFYRNFLPVLSKFLLELTKGPLPFLYEKYMEFSEADPDVCKAKAAGPIITEWKKHDVIFPKSEPANEAKKSEPANKAKKEKTAKNTGCCFPFFTRKLKETLHISDDKKSKSAMKLH